MANPVINVGPRDTQLSVTVALPAGGANTTSDVIDLSAIAPNSSAWSMGRFAIIVPAIAGNVADGITVTMKVAGPNLTASFPAPAAAVPAAFITPPVSQVATVSAVAVTGSDAQILYMIPTFDVSGSTYEFYEFVIASGAGVTAAGENIEIAWIKDSI
jgi:hypothetical protein